MSIWTGYSGLAIAFGILASLILWVSVGTRGKPMIKVLLIAATLWYSLALYYSAPNLMGWPTSQSVPDDSRVLAIQIKEPELAIDDPGAIFFWVSTSDESESEVALSDLLKPGNTFRYSSQTDPRAFQIPYTKEMHRAIIAAQRKRKGMPGSHIRIESKNKQGGEGEKSRTDSGIEFRIINPITLLPK